jgi:hypothetical protein
LGLAASKSRCSDIDSIFNGISYWIEKDVKKLMNPNFVLDSAEFYAGAHEQFFCTDCHSSDYESFPHPGELRYEPIYTCIDCHGGDDNYAKYKFELIEEEFMASVHSTDSIDDFSCWKCHDPHSFRLNVRTGKEISEIVAYDNDVCFSCHTDKDKFSLLSGEASTALIAKHDWLPNQGLHFSKVRCIECHTETHNDLLVAHKVTPSTQAVKKCAECHSKNSLLMSTLYKHQLIESRQEKGFFNATILNESYVIGASRNYYLNLISIVIFGLTLLGIMIHAILRIKIKKS